MPTKNCQLHHSKGSDKESYVSSLLAKMTLQEKIGQMSQLNNDAEKLDESIQKGLVGSVINEVDVIAINRLQKIAIQESRLGIPLLIGRDVIHGFNTIFPIPLGQAASWSSDIVELCAKIAAIESSNNGVNWTFAPMIDISRDPRWGRIAESLGEDPYLCSTLGTAMVKGFQGNNLSDSSSIAACAKHFAGYGASESGRDYNTTNIPENELRNVYLPPFKAVADAGISTFMASFSDLNGIPATGNKWLLNDILRTEWRYSGPVVSDWESIPQLVTHGFCADKESATFEACDAGVDMEMASDNYAQHLISLIQNDKISIEQIDTMVSRILKLKFDLGLFYSSFTESPSSTVHLNDFHLSHAKQAATKSCVLLKNNKQTLPLSKNTIDTLAVIGPLADDGYEQLGTWAFDGKASDSITCLSAIKDYVKDSVDVKFSIGMETSRSNNDDGFDEAINIASAANIAIMILGEEAILSGEAHCRSNINLPGYQEELINAIYETGTPIVLVIMAGRPITLQPILPKVDAVLFAWHPGTMGGPAITELLFGEECPSGKLPVTFPRAVGQIPLYYGQKNTGRPPSEETFVDINTIKTKAPQTSLGMTSTHLDTHYSPLFPFGFGLSYTQFDYKNIKVSEYCVPMGKSLKVEATITNTGDFDAEEIVQLYIRDLVGSVTRPVKELKGFKRIYLAAGQSETVIFVIHTDELAFYDRQMKFKTEPGLFNVWIGGNSDTELKTEFEVFCTEHDEKI
ncbi:glycoside hydrolase family 3 N-terminal domain-containing protein [Candidatus Colwellia aromaticivorans]|uniref:glycoside hydrolase family 3 N-terminal domain-containing protein n=1 Tax=Candidatus Colwellia aromaticivorans TaxID=2267621 RepID=UPI000DF47D43|nr:glycoside hydrolase family 3 N-terminal domain-containing protein [Candidatus Colwellia aromaticivorans]